MNELPKLIKAINSNKGRLYRRTILALNLLLLTFVRTNELINATWSDIGLENRGWTIPSEKMKMKMFIMSLYQHRRLRYLKN